MSEFGVGTARMLFDDRDLVFLILQFLDEENFKETVHVLEQESGYFFNMNYFEDNVVSGNWDEVLRYLSGFTKVDDNPVAREIFFKIYKQKVLETLRRHIVDMVNNDLKVCEPGNEELRKALRHVLNLGNLRENNRLQDTTSARYRENLLVDLKMLIEANPLFRDKLHFPDIDRSSLRILIDQSLNWQHHLCKNPRPNPVIKTIFVDHSCQQSNCGHAPSFASNLSLGSLPRARGVPPLAAHVPFQRQPTDRSPLVGWMSSPPKVVHPADSGGVIELRAPSTLGTQNRPRALPINPYVEYHPGRSDHVAKRTRPKEDGDVRTATDLRLSLTDESNEKLKLWELIEISDPSRCRSMRLPEDKRVTRISRLSYTSSGSALLALASNAIHLLWKWQRNEPFSFGKATASTKPQLWHPASGDHTMINYVASTNPEENVSCFALSKNDACLISASGGEICLFSMKTFKKKKTFLVPPPAATFLAFHPQHKNIVAIGMDDSTIQIYNVKENEVKLKLKGHTKKVTGLAFSNLVNVMVSSGADAQICVWDNLDWKELKKDKSVFLQFPSGGKLMTQMDTYIQLHLDQTQILVVHETQLAIYELTRLECLRRWLVQETSASISHATFSCDSQLVYVCFLDAAVWIFTTSNLRLLCRIYPSAYLPRSVSTHPVVIASNPQEPNQFAVGMSDGGVHVLEPLESEGNWAAPSSSNSAPIPPSVGASGSGWKQR